MGEKTMAQVIADQVHDLVEQNQNELMKSYHEALMEASKNNKTGKFTFRISVKMAPEGDQISMQAKIAFSTSKQDENAGVLIDIPKKQ